MDVIFKIPEESSEYPRWSEYVVTTISRIMQRSIETGRNRILLSTNLRHGLPLENINKVAGPFVEAWAIEQFENIADDVGNKYELINVEPGKRLSPFDIILQFKRIQNASSEYITANIDVKATAEDIVNSGKSPNITSFARIRTEYIEDPDYIFIILSLKHRVYSEKDADTGMTDGVMEVVSYNVYDLKYVSSSDLNYNPALGTGQLQIRDINYVSLVKRTTWELLQMLDAKFLRSRDEQSWIALAVRHGWIKDDG